MALVIRKVQDLLDDDAIERLGREAPGWSLEVESDGSLSMSPCHSDGGGREVEAGVQLYTYAKIHGGKTFGSSTGFRMDDLSVRAPDASWMAPEHIARLSSEQRTKYWRTCPDVVVEILSDSDSWLTLLRKLDMYIRNGALFAVAIDPFERCVETRGEPPAGLQLDYESIMDA